jgi:hypothetical protein
MLLWHGVYIRRQVRVFFVFKNASVVVGTDCSATNRTVIKPASLGYILKNCGCFKTRLKYVYLVLTRE